jgi:hypothetical protein
MPTVLIFVNFQAKEGSLERYFIQQQITPDVYIFVANSTQQLVKEDFGWVLKEEYEVNISPWPEFRLFNPKEPRALEDYWNETSHPLYATV